MPEIYISAEDPDEALIQSILDEVFGEDTRSGRSRSGMTKERAGGGWVNVTSRRRNVLDALIRAAEPLSLRTLTGHSGVSEHVAYRFLRELNIHKLVETLREGENTGLCTYKLTAQGRAWAVSVQHRPTQKGSRK